MWGGLCVCGGGCGGVFVCGLVCGWEVGVLGDVCIMWVCFLFVCFLFCFVLFIWSKVLYYQILELYLMDILVQVKPGLQAAIGLSILCNSCRYW